MNSTNPFMQFRDPNFIREHHLFDVIIGGLLGDFHAELMGKNYHLKIEQGASYGHGIYLYHLYTIFKDFVNPLTPPPMKVRNTPSGNISISYAFTTLTDPYFQQFATLFYAGTVKVIRAELENYLTPVALAYWYIDDGGLKSSQHKSVFLHTQSFTLLEVAFLCDMLGHKFGLDCHPVPERKGGKVYYKLYISGHSYEKLRSLIFPYLIPSMHYKFPTPRKRARS